MLARQDERQFSRGLLARGREVPRLKAESG